MLVDNFSAGIIGGAMAIVGLFWLGPIVVAISQAFGAVVQWLINLHLLPLAQIIIEPAKVLFLNNAINNGVLVPLGATQAARRRASRSCSCSSRTPAPASASCSR